MADWLGRRFYLSGVMGWDGCLAGGRKESRKAFAWRFGIYVWNGKIDIIL